MGLVGVQVNPRLGEVTQRVLVVCGTDDRLIPSKDEAGRLARRLPRCSTTMVEGGSHAMLMESQVDLMQVRPSLLFFQARGPRGTCPH
jgi:pimeloyl-ACP methyl ester carboxylesterase